MDQAYLALRLAVAELLFAGQPLLLDDIFVQYDDQRAQNGLAFLRRRVEEGKQGQTVLFTCHSRIRTWAEAMGGISIQMIQ